MLVARLGDPRDHEHGAVTGEGLLEAIKTQAKRRLVAENQAKPARLGLVYLLVRPKEPDPRLFMFMFIMGANITRQGLAGVEVRRDQVSFKVSLGIVL